MYGAGRRPPGRLQLGPEVRDALAGSDQRSSDQLSLLRTGHARDQAAVDAVLAAPAPADSSEELAHRIDHAQIGQQPPERRECSGAGFLRRSAHEGQVRRSSTSDQPASARNRWHHARSRRTPTPCRRCWPRSTTRWAWSGRTSSARWGCSAWTGPRSRTSGQGLPPIGGGGKGVGFAVDPGVARLLHLHPDADARGGL